jgi:hypothetical protein
VIDPTGCGGWASTALEPNTNRLFSRATRELIQPMELIGGD